jgi:Fe-Mn family superoxide dismutase
MTREAGGSGIGRRGFLKAAGAGAAVAAHATVFGAAEARAMGLGAVKAAAAPARTPGDYSAADFSGLIGKTKLSEPLLEMHFKLYNGYVANTNKVLAELTKLSGAGRDRTPEFAEVKRRLGWEFDGMRLHELYFSNLGGAGGDPPPAVAKELARSYGSVDAWRADLMATTGMRGIGWAVVYRDPVSERIANVWINEHDAGHFAGCTPLLVIDLFEHAFIPQFGLDKGAYVDAVMAAIKWPEVERRLGA